MTKQTTAVTGLLAAAGLLAGGDRAAAQVVPTYDGQPGYVGYPTPANSPYATYAPVYPPVTGYSTAGVYVQPTTTYILHPVFANGTYYPGPARRVFFRR